MATENLERHPPDSGVESGVGRGSGGVWLLPVRGNGEVRDLERASNFVALPRVYAYDFMKEVLKIDQKSVV